MLAKNVNINVNCVEYAGIIEDAVRPAQIKEFLRIMSNIVVRTRENCSNISASQKRSRSVRIHNDGDNENIIDEREHDEDVARYKSEA